ncbi:MAG: MATE family efflux transporter, partial [Paramuribaculum sp.]|nr:MATE family efflux transporter [Paramuribaculum sp.]
AGIFIGLTATRSMLLSMAVAAALYLAVCFIAFPVMGNHGLWLAFVTYLLTRGIVLSICYRRRRIR